MKHLKKFNTATDYDQFKSGSEFVLPNVSYIVDETEVKFNPYVAPANPNLVAIYNVTDTARESTLAGQYSWKYIESIIIDGIIEDDVYYQFDTTGEHTVEFVLSDKEFIDFDFFNNVWPNEIVKVEIPSSITKINASGFVISLDELKEVVFHSMTAPIITEGPLLSPPMYGGSPTGVLKYPKGADYSEIIATLPEGWTAVEF